MNNENKPAVDWLAIEVDYRAGIKPLRQMGIENGISHVAISKRAAKESWSRDLMARIKARADDQINKAAVNKVDNAKKAVTEKQVVEANADLQCRVRMAHRQDISRSRALFSRLLAELELLTDNKGLFAQLGALMATSDDDPAKTDKLGQLYSKVISLPGRVDSAKRLVETLEKLVRMEREAFGIDKDDGVENPIDAALKVIAQMKRDGVRPA
jgi:hypothetical protein